MSTAQRYLRFAEHEADGSSPTYAALARAVAVDPEVLSLLDTLEASQRQPNLFFATLRWLDAPVEAPRTALDAVRRDPVSVLDTMRRRFTQTNEVARSAALRWAMAERFGSTPVRLVELGAAAGLGMLPDRLTLPGDPQIDEGAVPLSIDTGGVAVPSCPPIVERFGLDRNPLDVRQASDRRWLEACIWPEHRDRRQRFESAVATLAAVVGGDALPVRRGDIVDDGLDLVAEVAMAGPTVVWHSAALNYLRDDQRAAVTSGLRHLVDQHSDLLWVSLEAAGLLGDRVPDRLPAGPYPFQLVLNGERTAGLAHPHGTWFRFAGLA